MIFSFVFLYVSHHVYDILLLTFIYSNFLFHNNLHDLCLYAQHVILFVWNRWILLPTSSRACVTSCSKRRFCALTFSGPVFGVLYLQSVSHLVLCNDLLQSTLLVRYQTMIIPLLIWRSVILPSLKRSSTFGANFNKRNLFAIKLWLLP